MDNLFGNIFIIIFLTKKTKISIYSMQNQTDLKQKLENISKVFKIDDVLNIKTSNEYTQKYYKINKIPYSLLHTKTDLMFIPCGLAAGPYWKA